MRTASVYLSTCRAGARSRRGWIRRPRHPEAFVILDDVADMEHLDDRLVRTRFETGLEDEHVEAAVAILGLMR